MRIILLVMAIYQMIRLRANLVRNYPNKKYMLLSSGARGGNQMNNGR